MLPVVLSLGLTCFLFCFLFVSVFSPSSHVRQRGVMSRELEARSGFGVLSFLLSFPSLLDKRRRVGLQAQPGNRHAILSVFFSPRPYPARSMPSKAAYPATRPVYQELQGSLDMCFPHPPFSVFKVVSLSPMF